MSAIFGICHLDGSPCATERLTSALNAMKHHALNGAHTHVDGSRALGYAAAWFTPESRSELLPLLHAETGIVLTSDARIDNRLELTEELGLSTASTREWPDSFFILHSYLKWGKDCPQHLIGDFVFVLWDPRSHEFFAARDAIGIRWLYFSLNPRQFAFASDMAGMLELIDEAPELDLIALQWYFRGSTNYNVRHTFYRNIYKLQPGHAMCVTENGSRQEWAYWDPENVRPTPLRDWREGAEMLRSLLDRAVADRCRSVDPVGTHLSGGLDSSALSAFAARYLQAAGRPSPLGFSWSPPYELQPIVSELDERNYIQRVAEHAGMKVFYTHVTPDTDALLETSDPSVLPVHTLRYEYQVLKTASQMGVRTMLSGWGGDEFAFIRPRNYLAGLLVQGRWFQLARFLFSRYKKRPRSMLMAFYQDALIPVMPPSWQVHMPWRFGRIVGPEAKVIQKFLRDRENLLPSAAYFQPEMYEKLRKVHLPSKSWYRPGLHRTQIAFLTPMLTRVESWSAWSARFGIRHVYPLLDQRLVEFSLSIPEEWAVLPEGSREMAYTAIDPVIPRSIFYGRDKEDRGLAAHGKTPEHKAEVRRLRFDAFDQLQKSNPPSAGWLNFEFLRAAQLAPDEFAVSPFKDLERRGIWEVLAFAYIDHRAVLKD